MKPVYTLKSRFQVGMLATTAFLSVHVIADACKWDNEIHVTEEETIQWLADIKASFGEKGPSQPQKTITTTNGLIFNSDYDNGSLESAAQDTGDEYDLGIYTENGLFGDRTYWFRFTIERVDQSSAVTRNLTLNIDYDENPRPVIRFRDDTTDTWSDWRRMTSAEAPEPVSRDRLEIDFPASDDMVELAFYFPLGMQETYDEVTTLVNSHPDASERVAGQSFLSNDIKVVTVNDTTLNEDEKFGIWVHSRAHAGEVTSTHTFLGFLEQFLANDAYGPRLRRYCRLDMIPLLNVDGTEIGYTRWDSQGIDPERQWCTQTIPSAQILKTEIDARIASDAPPVVVLNLHSTVNEFDDNFFFQRNLGNGTDDNVATPAFITLLQDYVDAFDAQTPLFDNDDPAFSNLRNCSSSGAKFIESYMWTQMGEQTMAMTHEGHYYYRTGSGGTIFNTGEDYREIGRAQARALIDFLSIPELPPATVDSWQIIGQQ